MSKVEQRVIDLINQRTEVGEVKYGLTMERDDVKLIDWFQHLQEELLDASIYIEKIKIIHQKQLKDNENNN
tara:strand:+ start:805 stop:1017 length:213 start_codon:yes stop_codon:yes gene_type:complete